MKHIYLFLTFIVCLSITSCSFLDIVPDERPTEEDAFKDRKALDRYLYSCYGFMPQERGGAFLYVHGETVSCTGDLFMEGNYSAANIGDTQYWSRAFGGIKRCYQLINNIDKVPGVDKMTRDTYVAEAKFLIAYFHFYLLRAYGPTIIYDKEQDNNTSMTDLPKRQKFDDCVNWVADYLDEAATEMLPTQPASDFGRATSVTAKALKARLLLYAASPLFNGNSEFYSDFVDPETKEPLINQTYDATKWERAYSTAVEAISLAEENGIVLYEGMPTEVVPEPVNPVEFSLRMTFCDRYSNEVIWADTRKEAENNLQNQCTPRDKNSTVDRSWEFIGPSLEVVKMFYTKNGLPVAEDPEYYSENQYFEQDNYLTNGKTCKLHLDREPRFYAWISFHNGTYELQRDNKAKIITQYGNSDPHGSGKLTRNFTPTGYLWKKGIHPSYSTANTGPIHYGWPLIRLGELYLNAAEAAVESNQLTEAKFYLNKIRKRAGIPDVEVSWAGKTLNQNKLREIIHQERNIELCFEGHHLWDLHRWKEAEKELNKNPHGLNINGEASTGTLFQDTEILHKWKFNSPTNYLLPIPTLDLNVNQKLVQNPGY